MSITSAQVEANGWVLRLTIDAAPGSFASYALDPGTVPRLVLTTRHAGFVPSGGQAVAGTMTRSLAGTAALRRPVNFASPTVKAVDETDIGGGRIEVRIALSEHVHAGDTDLVLAASAGWRTGQPAQAAVPVTNNSGIAAPLPIMRWMLRPYDSTMGAFRVALFVASHYPQGFAPVAGVRFTATDGVGTRSLWLTEMATDPSLGDNLRCYTGLIDPAGLNAGLLRVDAEVYPWLGAMRTTDPAGTRSMASLRTDGFSVSAQAPWVIGHDPAGTRYGQMWAYVDPVNGTTTAAAAMVQTSLALAKSVTPASRPRDINTARQAAYLVNRTLPAANGQASQARSCDGLCIVLAPGTHTAHGVTAVTSGLTEAEVPSCIIGDPDDADPRANCIIQTTAAQNPGRVSRILYQSLTIAAGTNSLASQGGITVFLDNVTIAGRPGLEGNSVGLFAALPVAGQWNLCVTRSRIWRYGTGVPSGNPRCGLYRANEFSRGAVQALAFVRNRYIGAAEDGFVTGTTSAWNGWSAASLAGQAEDIVLAGNDMRFLRGRAFSFVSLAAAIAGTPNPSMRRHAVIGNLLERIGADPQPFYAMGEDNSATMTQNIIEANTHAGERANTFYSDPLPAALADCDTQRNQAWLNRVAGNAYDWLPTKHDDFLDPQTNALRAGTADAFKSGYRPQMIEAWSMLYGVGHEGNCETGRVAQSGFQLEYYGLRSVGNAGLLQPLYADDRSGAVGGTGGGAYAPGAGSALLGRVVRGQSDRDFAGLARTAGSAAGAHNGPVAAGGGLVPALARSLHIAGSAALAAGGVMAPAAARMAQRAGAASVSWRGALAPARAVSGQLASRPALSWRATLGAASSVLGHGARPALLSVAGVIAPAGAAHVFSDFGVLPLLPGFDLSQLPSLRINADVRILRVFPG